MAIEYCPLASGSNGNCHYISTGSTSVLVDAGLSGKYIKNAMEQINKDIKQVNGIIITHEHSDHVKGVGVLMRRYGFNLYVAEETFLEFKDKIGKIDETKVVFISEEPFYIDDLLVDPFKVSHDACNPLGFSFISDSSKMIIVTDTGILTDQIYDKMANTDILLIESNHDINVLKAGKYPYFLKQRILSTDGHLSNEDAGDAIVEVFKRSPLSNIILGHLSGENNHPDLAYETVKSKLASNGIIVGKDCTLDVAHRKQVSKLYRINK